MPARHPHSVSPVGATARKGVIFIVSAPSGAGKTTLCRALLTHFNDLRYSISYTTRAARAGERDGIDYHFVTREVFEAGIAAGRWAEWARVHGNYYGTSAPFLDRCLAAGEDVLLDIDVQGAAQILERYPSAVTIFIMPPSLEVLRQRLEGRGTDSPEVIARRIANAAKEITGKRLYRHVILNDQLPAATAELIAVVGGYRRSAGPVNGEVAHDGD